MTPTTAQPRLPIDSRAERILGVALDEFARRGFSGARETVIARRSGVAMATLRLYFATKDELFREVVRSFIVTTLAGAEPVRPPRPPSGSAANQLRGFAEEFWRTMEQPGPAALLRLSLGELPRYPELALFHATEVIGRAAARLERTLIDGAARGELHVPDPRAASRVILSALLTHAHWFALPGIYSAITGPDRSRAEATVMEVLLDALRPVQRNQVHPTTEGSAA
jgi:AcrR family transcriptional regulator